MYTRNYRQAGVRGAGNGFRGDLPSEPTPEVLPETQSFEQAPSALTEEPAELPPGYSGTALLRERAPEPIENDEPVVEETVDAPREERRVRRYKMTRDIRHTDRSSEDNAASNERQADERAPEKACECAETEPKEHTKPRLRDRAFSIEDMLLSALIVLLVSEGADDVTVIILGFLLISEM